MRYRNYLGHDLTIIGRGNTVLQLEPEGTARVKMETVAAGEVEQIPLAARHAVGIADLPPPNGDDIFIVSSLVMAYAPERDDIAAPDTETALRDARGRIEAIVRLIVNDAPRTPRDAARMEIAKRLIENTERESSLAYQLATIP